MAISRIALAIAGFSFLILVGCDNQSDLGQEKAKQAQQQSEIDNLKSEIEALKKAVALNHSVQPEQCVLDTLKGSSSTEAGFVRWNCTRAYVKANLPTAIHFGPYTPISTYQVDPHASLVWTPAFTGLLAAAPPLETRDSLNEHITVGLLNNTDDYQIIAGTINIIDKASNTSQSYLGYAEAPIEPHTRGTIMATVSLNMPAGQNFATEYNWTWETIDAVKIMP